MEFNWIEIISYILTVLLGAAAVYFRHNAMIQERAANMQSWFTRLGEGAKRLIADAELEFQGTQRGGEKFNWVVDCLYDYLPPSARTAIGKDAIAQIVQGTFNSMATYAKIQLDRWVEQTLSEDDKEIMEGEDDAAIDNAV